MDVADIDKITEMAQRMRRAALDMALNAGYNGAHLGSGLSIIEIMATLYGGILRVDPDHPERADRDRFILSKGHGTLGYYTALTEVGLMTAADRDAFEDNGGPFPGQPVLNLRKGIEFSSGSLGMGLSQGVGVALAGKRQTPPYHVFVLMGDGECNEGTVWEAAMAASHFKLDNLVAIIDCNEMQSDGPSAGILDMGDIAAKWAGFGFDVSAVDGHDVAALARTFREALANRQGKPTAVIARTIKGKGVSFMENDNRWHHNRLVPKDYEQAVLELSQQSGRLA